MRWNVLAVLVTLVLVAVAVYFSRQYPIRFEQSAVSHSQTNEPTAPAVEGPQAEPASPPAITQPRYSNEIKKCTAPDGSTFYTNAVNCEAADLSQRVSVIDTPRYSSPARPAQNSSAAPKTAQPSPIQRPANRCATLNLRSNVPSSKDVPRSCRWEWGRALELERLMSGADSPASSTWAGEYCVRLGEIRQRGCSLAGAEFCYAQVCLGR